jgi:hypothetical protein
MKGGTKTKYWIAVFAALASLVSVFPIPADAFFDEVSESLSRALSERHIRINESRSQVQNNVSVSANTGGNTATPGGVVIQGESKAGVRVETIINSTPLPTIDIQVESKGEAKSIQKEIKYESSNNDARSVTQVDIQLNTSQEIRNVVERKVERMYNLWSMIANTFQSYLKNVFRFF